MAEKGIYGFFCPHCRKEITYNMTYYNDKISELKGDISKIDLELSSAKYNDQVDDEWKRRAVTAKKIKTQQLQELKSYRTAANEFLKRNVEHTFCQLIKEKYGEEEYKKIIHEAEKMCEKSSAINSMKKDYVRTDGKKIFKV